MNFTRIVLIIRYSFSNDLNNVLFDDGTLASDLNIISSTLQCYGVYCATDSSFLSHLGLLPH